MPENYLEIAGRNFKMEKLRYCVWMLKVIEILHCKLEGYARKV